jgi:hypothetical protein
MAGPALVRLGGFFVAIALLAATPAAARTTSCPSCGPQAAQSQPKLWGAGPLTKPARSQRVSSRRPLAFAFTARPPAADPDRTPLTVRARVTTKQAFLGTGSKLVQGTYVQTEAEAENLGKLGRGPSCRFGDLICSSLRRPGVKIVPLGNPLDDSGRLVPRGFRVEIGPLPVSDPPQATGGRRRPKPYGVDVEIRQSGRSVARLRVAGRCDAFVGQSSSLIRCSIKKLRFS